MFNFSNGLTKLLHREDLAETEARKIFDAIMDGAFSPVQISAFLTALAAKGETIDELTGAAKSMRAHAVRINPPAQKLLDTCGTGGDKSGTFNISTTVAFVVAGAGVSVAKHGNRAVSSKCGSADVLEALGVKIDLKPAEVEKCIAEIGIGFLFAPNFHPAMKYAAPVRKELGVRTIFNLLGPLTNPAGAAYQLLGVFAPQFTELLASALLKLGAKKALVVHGEGLDEVTLAGKTRVSEISAGAVRTYFVEPEDFGLERAELKDLSGSDDPAVSAEIVLDILKGVQGARRDAVLVNASAALVAAEEARDFCAGVEKAKQALDTGAALKKLKMLQEFGK
jgi:anthranilate phosphoribosyltransferase